VIAWSVSRLVNVVSTERGKAKVLREFQEFQVAALPLNKTMVTTLDLPS
jgi:hypothetical protein